MCQVVEFLNCIPNLEYAALEELVRENEIDGESLLLLTQVPMLRLNIYPSFPDTKNVRFEAELRIRIEMTQIRFDIRGKTGSDRQENTDSGSDLIRFTLFFFQ